MAEATFKESHTVFREVQNWHAERVGMSDLDWSRTPQDRSFHNWAEGQKNPKWRSQIILGQNATTPFLAYEHKILKNEPYSTFTTYYPTASAPSSYYTSSRQDGTQFFLDPSAVEGEVAGVDLGEANSIALGQLVEDIRDKHASFKGSTSLAELSKTIALLRNPAKALRKGVGGYLEHIRLNGRKWRRSGRKAASRALAETWLEYAFGWTPLLLEVKDAKKAIASGYKQGLHERVWAVGVGETNGLLSKTNPYWSNYYSTLGAPKVARRTRYYAKVVYSSNLGYSTTGPIVQDLGFTPREWAPALWEVVPWSFLVDYFVNIDEIITGLSYIDSGVSFTNKTTVQIVIEDYPFSGKFRGRNKLTYESANPTTTGNSGSFARQSKRVNRSEYLGSLVPPPRFSLPGFGRKWLNMSALAVANKNALRALR